MAMSAKPSSWQLDLARLEGALDFLPETIGNIWAMRSLQRIWRVHIRDYPFENIGLEHDSGIHSSELMRSWYSEERGSLLAWIQRRGTPSLVLAAQCAAVAKCDGNALPQGFADAEAALARLDALLPTADPLATLTEFVRQLREEETSFLEGDSEMHIVSGRTFTRRGSIGAAWAASLAVAMRPHLFSLGRAPIALPGLTPRALFRSFLEDDPQMILEAALYQAAQDCRSDLQYARRGLATGNEVLAHLYASSRATDAWMLLLGLGPLTRAELTRALDCTKRTASQAAAALESVGLVEIRADDSALIAKLAIV